MPRAPRRCTNAGCDELQPCTSHPPRDYRTERSRYGSRHERHYDAGHVKRAASLRQTAKVKRSPCELCGQPIDFALRAPHPKSFAAHHRTRDRNGPLGPAHKRCNEQAGQPLA